MAEYKSNTVVVDRSPRDLFNMLTNVEGIIASLPEDKRQYVSVDGDNIIVEYVGFRIVINIKEKLPFSRFVLTDAEAPFHFTLTFHFDPAELLTQTTLWIEVFADLNFMMKTMLGSKIQEALDQMVQSIAYGGTAR